MTPAQQVAIDMLCEAFDETTAQRMVLAIDPNALITRERALDAIFRMSNWQHGYGQSKLANTNDCVRCLDAPRRGR